MKHIYWLLIFLLWSVAVLAQTNTFWNNTTINAKYQHGVIFPHHYSIEYLTDRNLTAINIELEQQWQGQQLWQQIYRYPQYGIGYYYAYLPNPEIFGQVHALYPYIKIPARHNQRFGFSYAIAAGTAYLTKSFDIKKNLSNIAIGGNWNVYFHIHFEWHFRLMQRLHLLSGFAYTHYSSAKISLPNTGLNTVAIYGAFRWTYRKQPLHYIENEIPDFQKKNEFSVIYNVGIKSNKLGDSRRYPTSSLILNLERKITRKRRFGIGIDVFYDATTRYRFYEEQDSTVHTSDLFRSGFHISQDLDVGPLAFTVQFGYYFYSPCTENGPIYNRFGIKYRFSEKWFAHIALKAHFAKADFLEWGVGYYF